MPKGLFITLLIVTPIVMASALGFWGFLLARNGHGAASLVEEHQPEQFPRRRGCVRRQAKPEPAHYNRLTPFPHRHDP